MDLKRPWAGESTVGESAGCVDGGTGVEIQRCSCPHVLGGEAETKDHRHQPSKAQQEAGAPSSGRNCVSEA